MSSTRARLEYSRADPDGSDRADPPDMHQQVVLAQSRDTTADSTDNSGASTIDAGDVQEPAQGSSGTWSDYDAAHDEEDYCGSTDPVLGWCSAPTSSNASPWYREEKPCRSVSQGIGGSR